MEYQKAKFLKTGRDVFYDTLKERVNAYMKANNLTRYATPVMVSKLIAQSAIFITCYTLILTNRFTPLQCLAFAFVMAVMSDMFIFNVGHDAVHHVLFKNKKLNIIAYTMSFLLIGDNANMWKRRHLQSHHNYVNINGMDSDIEVIWLLRFTPYTPFRNIHRYQHIYAPFIYLFYTLYWVTVSDIKYLGKKRIFNFIGVQNPNRDLLHWALAKVFYYVYLIVIPIIVLNMPWWYIIIGFVLMHFVSSYLVIMALICTHLFEAANLVKADEKGILPYNWAAHQVENCQDFNTQSKFANMVLGGQNTHTAHHLFPRICHVHYPAISQIIKATAREFGIKYNETTFFGGMMSHYRLLRKYGIEEANRRQQIRPAMAA